MLHSKKLSVFRSSLAIGLSILILAQISVTNALSVVSITRTGSPTATGALFGSQIDVLVSSPVALSGSVGSRILSGTGAGVPLSQISESLSGATFQYLLRTPTLGLGATQGLVSTSIQATTASGSIVTATGSSPSLRVDTISPTVVLSSTTSTGTTLSGSVTIRATFSEPMSGVTLAGFTASGGTLSTLAGSGAVYTFSLIPTANIQTSSVNIRLNAGVVGDLVGNLNTVSNILTWSYDTLRPTTTLTAITPTAPIMTSATGSFRLTSPENIFGVSTGSLNVNSTGWLLTSITGTGTTYTIVFTPTPLTNSGVFRVNLPINTVRDRVGLLNTTSNTLTWNYDTRPPIVTLNGTGVINIANTSSYTLSGSCSENSRNVTLTLDSITTTSPCTSGSYSKTFSTASAVDGTISLDISQTDLAGNTGTISSSIIKDTGVPTVGIDTLPLIQATTATGYLVTGLCSENTRLVSLSVTDGVLTRSANITCTGGVYSGSMDVSSLSESLITFTATLEDRVGNAATPSVRYTSKDTVYPGLSLTATSPVNIANVNLLPFSGLCSENTQTILLMAGSQSGSIACTFGSFSGALDLSSLPDGNMTLTGSHRDTAGNTTLRAITLIKDTIRPSISLMSLSSTGVTQSGSITISLGGSESLLWLSNTGVTATGGTISSFLTTASGATFILTPTSNIQSGNISVSYTLPSTTDSVGNPSLSSNTLSWNYDTLLPSITLSSDYLPSVVLSGSVLVTITPSESLLSVGSGSLSIVGGVLASFTQSGSLSNYRVMAPSNTQSGSLQVTFATGSLTDLVGNPLLGQTTRSWSYDTRFPTLVSQSWTATGTTAVGFTARHSFAYDEGVSTTLRVFSGATNILTRNQTSSGSNHTLDNTVFSLDGGRSYTYEILAADRVGNTITSTGGFLVPHDSSPDRFGFGSVNTPLLANPVSSSTGIVTGITGSIPVSIVGGLYQIDNGALTSLPGSVSSGAIITLQLTSGGTVGEIRTATLSLGDLQIPFSVTTISTGAPIPSSGGGGGGGSSFTIFGPSISTPVSTIDTGKSVSGGATIKNPPALPTCTVYSTIPRTLKASDITGHWAEISIRKSLSKGYLLNTRSVQPNSGMTRIAFVSFLARVYPCEGFGVASKLSWSDVPKGSTLEENLKRFAAKGWMNGSGGKFRPNDQITRREALEVIARILGIPASSSGVSQFGDLQKWDPSTGRMNELRARGILSGGNLRPNASITVAEIMSSFDTAFWGK